MNKLSHNSHHTNSLQSQESLISEVLGNYQQTITNCEHIIQQTKQKIWKRVAFETTRIPMLENMIQASLREVALPWHTFKPDYRAFGELRNCNDEQIYQLQSNCPDIQSLLEHYQQKDKEQLDVIIRKLQDIVDEYQKIVDYCTHMIKNAHNRNSLVGAQLAHYGLDAFSATTLRNVNHIRNNTKKLMDDYNKRVASESGYTEIQTFVSINKRLSN